MPFKDAKKICYEFLQLSLSVTLIESVVTRIGSQLHRICELKGKRPYAIKNKEQSVETLYIEADGSMVPIVGKGKREFKENKLGILFNNNDIVQKKHKNGKLYSEIKQKKYVSSIGEGVEPFKKMLYASAIEKGYYGAKNVIFLSDGAAWLGKCKDEYFPNSIQILDWYHAVEHLWLAAYKIYGDDNKELCQKWVEPLEKLLWDGDVNKVIKKLEEMASKELSKKQTPLYELRGYYASNREQMRYDEYRKNGWYIGSCAIESANKYIVSQRLKRSGMQWRLHNADAVIWVRCKYYEDQWGEFWNSMKLNKFLNIPVEKREAA